MIRMRPTPGGLPNAKQRAEGKAFLKKEVSKVGRGVKNYGKNVAGGAKIVATAIKRGVKMGAYPITRAIKKVKGEPARLKAIDNANRAKGIKLNKESSGR